MDSSTAVTGQPRLQQIDTSDHIRSSPSQPLSPLLLERLQRLRQAENDRMSARSSNDRLSSSGSSRHVRSPSPTSSNRPGSSGGLDPAKVKKGLGVKEMEQTLSSLHKQNFDLKLELYHRRERQTALEARIEALEREVRQRDELHDSLVKELEKRDKAVEEAIGMILTLEKRVEQLLLERNMVRRIEAEEAAFSRINSPVTAPAAKETQNQSGPQGQDKTPNRMPSFVSDRSAKTENLRSVYLGAIAGESSLSLPRPVEDTPDTVRVDPRAGSPALSELSESSFASIYGRDRTMDLAPRPGDSPWPWDGGRASQASETPTRVKSVPPTRQHRPHSPRAQTGQYHNIKGILDSGPSPLQRLAMLDVTWSASNDTPKAPNRDKNSTPRPSTAQGQYKTKKEKREALEKVLTQGHFNTPQTFPPTPDTLSTTTLQHETPTRERGMDGDRGFSSEANTPRSQRPDSRRALPQPPQTASTTAFDSRKNLHNELSCASPGAAEPQLSHASTGKADDRVHSGSDADTTRPRSRARRASTASSVDTWLHESMKPESTDAVRPMSSVSQAHSKNDRISPDLFSFPTTSSGWATDAMFATLGGTGYIRAGGKAAPDASVADMMDAMAAPPPPPIAFPGRKAPMAGAGALPLPDRRSSLAAKTGAPSGIVPGMDSIPQSPARVETASVQMRSPPRGTRARSNSTDRPPSQHLTAMNIGLKQDRPMTVPPKQIHQPPPPQLVHQQIPSKNAVAQPLPKQRHYPPTTSRPHSRGLNSFFRRSTGSADVPVPPASAPPADSPFKPPPQPSSTGILMGIPSWVRRASLGDGDRASVAPPPIQRNQAATVGGNSRQEPEDEDGDGGVALEPAPAETAPSTPGSLGGGVKPRSFSRKSWSGQSGYTEGGDQAGGGAPLGAGGNAGSNGGGKRKWLGLGRVSSLRNRGA
ncbi:hypothetical protein VTJ04DRAFT_9532 [Mycothermus thermophilus]|uniref:uncharacterized protein n=1 Tax=Humicola insolens TaxID=85995 RepID=UPI0037433C3E